LSERTAMQRRPVVLWAALGCVLLTGGCTFRHERLGAPISLEATFDLEAGVTTLRSALKTLGPPDRVVQLDGILRLVYQYRRQEEAVFRISYRLQLISVTDGEGENILLLLDFDEDDRLTHIVRPRPDPDHAESSEAAQAARQ
jgi:hypothetical protein